jgi:pyruvate, water dikinase
MLGRSDGCHLVTGTGAFGGTPVHILWFHEYEPDHAERVGGKCGSLGAMTRAGLPVPPGFAVTTDAFSKSLARNDVGPRIHADLAGLDVHDLAALEAAAAAARREIMDSGPAHDVDDAIRVAYAQLCERTGVADVPVAVRSSATAEDQPDASFAGQQDTYLWIRGEDEVVNHVVRCWASLYTDRAIAYRHEQGYPHDGVNMSVGVQQMVHPRAAGVAFTIDPTNGDRSKVVIEASWGLGETVVSGSVTPDNFVVDKVVFEIVKRTVSAKEVECVHDPIADTVVHRELSPERSAMPSLTDDEVKAVARLARQAEKHFGRPQDVEWAVDHDADGQPRVHLLQSRPETVWSNRPRQSVTSGAVSTMDGVVQTLLNPVRVRNN